jgi:radical SAM superfamily enzyme YgiQ (UPF0313 family)
MFDEGPRIRPPSEAQSFLLQIAVGCPHGQCAFCGAYAGLRHRPRSLAEISACIAREAQPLGRVFLCDGDALFLETPHLVEVLHLLRQAGATRIASYASSRSLTAKTPEELCALRSAGLSLLYVGLESGSDTVLKSMNKGIESAGQMSACVKAKAAGFKLNCTVLLGLGGVEGSQAHAQATGDLLSAIDPEQVAALTLMLIPGTPIEKRAKKGVFRLPDAMGMLRELRVLLAATNLSRGLFLSNHASNFVPLTLRLPQQKADGLAILDAALSGELALRPDWMRAL